MKSRSSTAQVKTSRFTPHGNVDMWMDGQLMHYEARGPFNLELVNCLAIAQRDYLLAARPRGVWASVCTVLENAMGSPDGMARYGEVIAATPDDLKPVATAFVMAPGLEGGPIMAPMFAKAYANIGRPFKMFSNMEQACEWANAMIAQAGSADVPPA